MSTTQSTNLEVRNEAGAIVVYRVTKMSQTVVGIYKDRAALNAALAAGRVGR